MTTLRRAVASAARQSFAGLKLSSAARTSIEAASALGRRRESNFMQEPPRPRRVPQQVHRQVVVERTRAVSAVVLAPRGKRQLRMLLSYPFLPAWTLRLTTSPVKGRTGQRCLRVATTQAMTATSTAA